MTRLVIAYGLVVYAALLLGVDVWLQAQPHTEGLWAMRQALMGRAALVVGAGASVAAIVFGVLAGRRGRLAVVLAVGWAVVAAWAFATGRA